MPVCGAPIYFFSYYPITSNSDMDSREIEEDGDAWMVEWEEAEMEGVLRKQKRIRGHFIC